jgi:hypothetical protein
MQVVPIAILVIVTSVRSITAQNAHFFAEGVVVAIQEEEGGSNLWDPNSMGDRVQVFIVRTDKWPQDSKVRLITIGYSHHDRPIALKQFDNTVWRFELHGPGPTHSDACSEMWVTLGRSVKTAFGTHLKLPKPETLPC